MPDKFLTAFPPTATTPMPAAQLARLAATAPPLLGQLWQQHGLGLYGEGIIQLIDPAQFRPVLATWLAADRPNYTPFALGAFGQLYYHRQLTPTDEDVCCLDPHYRSIATCAWSLEAFLNDYLPDPDTREEELREPLLQEALAAHGALPPGCMYSFTPALVLGGDESVDGLVVSEATVQLDFLFQVGL